MKLSVGKKKLLLYLWLSVGCLVLWVLHELMDGPDDIPAKIINLTWRMLYITTVNFIFFEYVLPTVVTKKQHLIANIIFCVLSLIALLLFYSFGSYAWRSLGIVLHIYHPLAAFATWKEGVTASTSLAVGSFVIFGIVTHIYNYLELRSAAQQLRLEKQQAELNFLKSQTNPHFLFNTLNNIYSLTMYRPELAPESVLRLSKILRFMLYEADADFIPVEKDMKILNDYIDLEKLRYDEKLKVSFTHDMEDMQQPLPPLLLMPLAENAFKHGMSESTGERFIDMHLHIRQKQLTFVVRNSVEENPLSARVKENIGLSNLRRQLELLYKDYHLSVAQEKGVFTATLKINLNSHV